MNAYMIDGGVHLFVERIGDYQRYLRQRVYDLVFAPNRGRAKSLFFQRYKDEIGEYTSIRSVRLVARDVDRQEGFARHDDPLWDVAFLPPTEEEEDE